MVATICTVVVVQLPAPLKTMPRRTLLLCICATALFSTTAAKPLDFSQWKDCHACVDAGHGWCPIRRKCGGFTNPEFEEDYVGDYTGGHDTQGLCSFLRSAAEEASKPRPAIMGTNPPHAASNGANKKETVSPTPPVECLSKIGPFKAAELQSRI